MIRGYKAFNKGLVCRDFQFQEGETFTHEGRFAPCDSGFHFCENPLDVLDYYPLINHDGELSDFAEVEALGKVKIDENKSVTNVIKIGAKLGLSGFIKASFDFLWQKCSNEPTETDSGQSGARLASSGYGARLASSGDSAQLALNGEYSVGAAIGRGENRIRGVLGNWITLAEWIYDRKLEKYKPICVKSAKIDGWFIKADTFYALKNGEFIEVE